MQLLCLLLSISGVVAYITLSLDTIKVFSSNHDTYFVARQIRNQEEEVVSYPEVNETVTSANSPEFFKTPLSNSSSEIDAQTFEELPIEQIRTIFEQTLDNYYNYQYIGSVNFLNEQGQINKYRVIFDSGSSWVWLPRQGCLGCPTQGGITCNSTACIESNHTLNVTYALGGVQGILSEAQLGFDEDVAQYKKSRFLLVNSAWGMDGALYQGIIGLELENENPLITWPVGFYLSSGSSQINLGGVNSNLLSEQMQYVNVSRHWMMEVAEFHIVITRRQVYSITIPSNLNDKSEPYIKPYQSIIDSGSSLIMLPKVHLEKLQQALLENSIDCAKPDLSISSIKCSCPTQQLDLFPILHLTFANNVKASLEPQYYIHTHPESHICHLMISPLPSHDDTLIVLGNPFMRKYYTLFDRENKRVGLARSIQQKEEPPTRILKYIMVVGCSSGTALLIILLINHLLLKRNKQQVMNYRMV